MHLQVFSVISFLSNPLLLEQIRHDGSTTIRPISMGFVVALCTVWRKDAMDGGAERSISQGSS